MWQFCVRRNQLLTEGFPKTVYFKKNDISYSDFYVFISFIVNGTA